MTEPTPAAHWSQDPEVIVRKTQMLQEQIKLVNNIIKSARDNGIYFTLSHHRGGELQVEVDVKLK